ncbi:MAG: DUF5671 domain-containing protein [bacterium]|nr:DUF5671 domain-containing protein [bacterium]
MEQTIAPQKASPKEVFLHLFSIITLYVSAVALGTLLFQFVNLGFPDALNESYPWALDGIHSAMRFAISSLVVAFPAFLWTMRTLAKSYATDPERRNVRIRKWLVYFTLFVAGLIMVGDLIALLNSFLQGELTVRFALKVVAVFLVSGAVFWYYRSDNRQLTTDN